MPKPVAKPRTPIAQAGAATPSPKKPATRAPRIRGARAWGVDAPVDTAAVLKMLGQNIRAARQILGLRQKDLAEMTGLPQDHVSRIEKGERNITMTTLVLLAMAVKRDVAELLTPEMHLRPQARAR